VAHDRNEEVVLEVLKYFGVQHEIHIRCGGRPVVSRPQSDAILTMLSKLMRFLVSARIFQCCQLLLKVTSSVPGCVLCVGTS